MIRAVGHCEVCGKALGLRRAAQGLRRHPGCRRMLGQAELSAALQRTRQVLEKVSVHTEDEELDPLLAEAARQARAVMKDLQRMKDYVNRSRKSEERPRPGQESPSV